jgi:transcriptional regulator with XRE-family HTH domain
MTKNRIAEVRKARGISQSELAAGIGTGRSQIAKLELGERQLTPKWIERIARFLDCDPSEFVIDDGAPRLSPREQAMLDLFRHLDQAEQDRIMKIADALAELSGPHAQPNGTK